MDRTYLFGCESFMANRMGLGYISWQDSKLWWVYTDLYIQKVMLTCLSWPWPWHTWPLYTPENGFQGATKTPRRPFPRLCSSFLCPYCWKNKTAKTGKTWLSVLSIIDRHAITCMVTSIICLCSISSLYLLSTLYVTHMVNYSRPSTAFLYCKRWKAGQGLGTRLPRTQIKANIFSTGRE